jgi:TRAP-type C4-dicarboxylate transport system permease large subunit
VSFGYAGCLMDTVAMIILIVPTTFPIIATFLPNQMPPAIGAFP